MTDSFDLAAVIRDVTGGRPVADVAAVTAEVLRRVPVARHPLALAQAVRLILTDAGRVPSPAPPPTPPTSTSEPAAAPTPSGEQHTAPSPSAPPAAPQPAPRRFTATPTPNRSWKVAGVRDAWRDTLDQQVNVGDGSKRLGDCTRDDLKLAADVRDEAAATHQRHAARFRRLAALLAEHNVDYVHELPADAVTGLDTTVEVRDP